MNKQAERSAEVLYRQILEDPAADLRLKTSLQRIKAVCDLLEREVRLHVKNGVRFTKSPITVAAVGRKCVERYGGPSAESITRNRRKEPVKALYIESRARELSWPRVRTGEATGTTNVSQSGQDYVAHLESKVRLLEQFVSGLSASLKKMAPVSIDALIDAAFATPGTPATPPPMPALISTIQVSAQRALAKLFDDDHLRGFGLRMDRGYLINATSGDELLNNSEVDALRAAVGPDATCVPSP